MTDVPATRRLGLVLAYDGRPFAGWQQQPGRETVQASLEKALELTAGEAVVLHASGRTDTGVHAHGQVAHVDVPASRAAMAPENWLRALNTRLPTAIRVLAVREVDAGFHARFDALGKTYCYRLWTQGPLDPLLVGLAWAPTGQLDLDLLETTAARLCGRHDFAAFAACRADGSDPARGEESVRTVHAIERHGEGAACTLEFHGAGFHYRMVRLLVGGLVEVARGRYDADELVALLEQPADSELRKSPLCAPADGLVLHRVWYRQPGDDRPEPMPHPWDRAR